ARTVGELGVRSNQSSSTAACQLAGATSSVDYRTPAGRPQESFERRTPRAAAGVHTAAVRWCRIGPLRLGPRCHSPHGGMMGPAWKSAVPLLVWLTSVVIPHPAGLTAA